MSQYRSDFLESVRSPETFWARQASAIEWIRKPTRVLDRSRDPIFDWFSDGSLNTAFNAVDRHVRDGNGDRTAVIYDSPVTGESSKTSYAELQDQIAQFAGALRSFGAQKGDRVLIYMPMVPQAVVAMLACARIGAVHCVVFGGFAAPELAKRIDDAKPRIVVSASCGIERYKVIPYKPILDKAIELSRHRPDTCIILPRPQAKAALVAHRDVTWEEALRHSDGPADCVEVQATDALYVLYTSGTTGQPKGVVRDNGGHAVALTWALKNVFDIGPGDTWWSASDIGWVVGHSFMVYAPLFGGATTVLYEGKPVGTPDASAFWRVIAEYGVSALFTAPTAIRAIRQADPGLALKYGYDTSSLRHLFLAGERLDPSTFEWASRELDIPIVDNWWQTETGWPIAANLRGLAPMPLKPGSSTVPVPGFDVRILDGNGSEVAQGEEGAICVRLPLPPGALTTLSGGDQRYVDAYLSTYRGFYLTGDGGYFDDDGYLYVMGRTDDVINVAGHRFSTGEIEAVLGRHEAVAECAVIGLTDELKGQTPLALIVLKTGYEDRDASILGELVTMVRLEIGSVAGLRDVRRVEALPKTRSGKILRKTMRAIAEGRNPATPSTIEDETVLDSIRAQLRR